MKWCGLHGDSALLAPGGFGVAPTSWRAVQMRVTSGPGASRSWPSNSWGSLVLAPLEPSPLGELCRAVFAFDGASAVIVA